MIHAGQRLFTHSQFEKMKNVCSEHANNAEQICLNSDCSNRLMCLLCQHNHQLFSSIRQVGQVDLASFQKKVNLEIDKSLAILEEMQKSGTSNQREQIESFYDSVQVDLCSMLENRKINNIRLLAQNSNSDIDCLIKARIQGKYHELSQETFAKIKQVYDGMDLLTLARQEKQKSLEEAYNEMKRFHEQCSELFSKFEAKLKTKVPQIRIPMEKGSSANVFESYDEQLPSSKLKQNLKYSTKVDEFSSLISDCYSTTNQILAVSYDKNVRVFDKKLNLLACNQFGNILMKIQAIGEQIYALGVSKQLHISKISEKNKYSPESILVLRGHKQRICDIHSLNTRIVSSCSEEGSKIWDLYKQKCEYTIKDTINPSCLRFMKGIKHLAVGYHNHQVKAYTLEKIRAIRTYMVDGTPLCLSQQNQSQNLIYCGGFPSNLTLFDIRVSKQVFKQNVKGEAITCFKESLFEQNSILLGERGGRARVFDLRKMETRISWKAHEGMTNLSKPNGVVRIFEESSGQILTAGCNDKCLRLWQLQGENNY